MSIQRLKEATQIAASFLQEFYPNIKDIQLEEVEKFGSSGWSITLSYSSDAHGPLKGLSILSRGYKVITMNDKNEIISMKIRNTEQ